MFGFLETGLVVSAILMLLAIDFLLWLTVTTFLLGLLGWHPPGWLASPVAHATNTGLAIAGAAMSIAVPIIVDLALKKL